MTGVMSFTLIDLLEVFIIGFPCILMLLSTYWLWWNARYRFLYNQLKKAIKFGLVNQITQKERQQWIDKAIANADRHEQAIIEQQVSGMAAPCMF